MIPLYEGLNPKIVNKEDSKKYENRGYLDNDFDFSALSQLSINMDKSIFLLKGNTYNPTDEKIKEIRILEDQILRRVKLLESAVNSELELSESKTNNFYVKRLYIEFDDKIKNTRELDSIDIVLTDNFTILNKFE